VKQIPLTRAILDRMVIDRIFKLPSFSIALSTMSGTIECSLSLNASHFYPISGFPRCLFLDDQKDPSSKF
jgi:hypothetical protein